MIFFNTNTANTKDSWCFYKRDLSIDKHPGGHAHRVHNPLHYERLHKHIWPIYERLTDIKLLERCEYHATQNGNESLHSVIWSKCTKSMFHSKDRVEFSAIIAIAEFNFGPEFSNSLAVEHIGVSAGDHSNRLSAEKCGCGKAEGKETSY